MDAIITRSLDNQYFRHYFERLKRLNKEETKVFLAICAQGIKSEKNLSGFLLDLTALIKDTELSRPSVRKCLARLEEIFFIIIDNKSQRIRNVYINPSCIDYGLQRDYVNRSQDFIDACFKFGKITKPTYEIESSYIVLLREEEKRKKKEYAMSLKKITEQGVKINKQSALITEQGVKLNKQSDLINEQSSKLNKQSTLLTKQSSKLNQQSDLISEQGVKLNKQSTLITEQSSKLNQQSTLLNKQSSKLNKQSDLLNKQTEELESLKESNKAIVDLLKEMNTKLGGSDEQLEEKIKEKAPHLTLIK